MIINCNKLEFLEIQIIMIIQWNLYLNSQMIHLVYTVTIVQPKGHFKLKIKQKIKIALKMQYLKH